MATSFGSRGFILSPYMILTHRVLVVDKAALQKIEEVYA